MRTFIVAIVATIPTLSAPVHALPAHAAVDLGYEGQAATVTNVHRTRHGLRPLRPAACLARFAQRHADRMADQQRIFHQDLAPIMRRCDLSGVGENVAYDYKNGRSVVNQGWMLSAGHRQNILNRQFRIASVGAARSRTGSWYTAQVLGSR